MIFFVFLPASVQVLKSPISFFEVERSLKTWSYRAFHREPASRGIQGQQSCEVTQCTQST